MHGLPSLSKSILKKKVDNGDRTRIWLDEWLGEVSLAVRYPWLFILESDKETCIAN